MNGIQQFACQSCDRRRVTQMGVRPAHKVTGDKEVRGDRQVGIQLIKGKSKLSCHDSLGLANNCFGEQDAL